LRSLSLFTLAVAIASCAHLAAAEVSSPTAIHTESNTSATQPSVAGRTINLPPLSIDKDKIRPGDKMLMVKIRIYDKALADGNVSATSTVLSRPSVMTLENVPFSLVVGQHVPVPDSSANELVFCGLDWRGTLGTIKDGRVRADFTISTTNAVDKTEDHLQYHTDVNGIVKTVKLGEVSRMRLGNFNGNESVWAEFQIDERKK
jgi:hypothetical protein